MGKLQTGRFERLGARTYSIKGPGALVDLDETVLGVIQLERQAGMEAHLMQEWETFGFYGATGGAAGNYTYQLLSNPVGSGRIMVLDYWQRGGTAALASAPMSYRVTRGVPPGFAALAAPTALDTRIASSRQPAGTMFWDQTASYTVGNIVGVQSSAEQTRFQVVLAPDGSFVWGTEGQNEALAISIRWAERQAAPFEL